VRFVSKKKVGAAVAALAVAGGGLAAYAYFTSNGSANGSAGVGTSTAWSVTGFNGSGLPASTGLLYPGAGSAALAYRITNGSTGHQAVTSVTVAVAADGSGNVLDSTSGTGVSGCLAAWFSPGSTTFKASDGTTTVTLPVDLVGADFITGSTAVTMSNIAASQDACKLASPRLTVTVG
jgi:hypothetical protein